MTTSYRYNFIKANPGVRRRGMGGYWYRCANCGKWCGRPGSDRINIPDSQKMEVDHILCKALGGSNELYNLQPLCRPCNRTKSDNMNFRDNCRTVVNTIQHPVDGLIAVPIRKAMRQNKTLKKLGITKRR